jgi:DNA-binding transcriptional ArsR family regulator
MPARDVAASELGSLMSVFSHPHRILIVEALRNGELDVNQLSETLAITHARTSQHLAQLRSHRLVHVRREGRHVYYRLADERLADWLIDGLDYVEQEAREAEGIREAVEAARTLWSSGTEDGGRH